MYGLLTCDNVDPADTPKVLVNKGYPPSSSTDHIICYEQYRQGEV